MEQIKDYSLKHALDYTLSDDQNEIVDFLLRNPFSFNCAQTGFGKTLTTITAAVHNAINNKEQDYHYILLLPNSAVKAFTDTLGKHLGLPFSLYTAERTVIKNNARFHIFNYSTIGRGLSAKDKTQMVKELKSNRFFMNLVKLKNKYPNLWLIADEAHALQDTNTIQYTITQAIIKWFKGIWFLTATPILNDLEGFFNMVTLVRPDFSHGSIYAFRNKYMIYKDSYYFITRGGRKIRRETKELVGYKNLDVLAERFSQFSIIKTKKYDLDFEYRSTSISDNFKQFYKAAGDGLFSATRTKSGKRKKKQLHAGARLHDLQMVVSNSHPDIILNSDPLKVTDKEILLVNTIKEVLDKNEATLIYFTYRSSLERIKFILNRLKDDLGISSIFEISGDISITQRKRVEDLISPKSITLITSAGTESVNLQKANNLIFYEIPFALRHFVQACGRITRFNSTYNKFTAYILEAEGTIDTYKKNRIIANMTPIRSVLGDSDTLPTALLEFSLEEVQLMKDEYLWWK